MNEGMRELQMDLLLRKSLDLNIDIAFAVNSITQAS